MKNASNLKPRCSTALSSNSRKKFAVVQNKQKYVPVRPNKMGSSANESVISDSRKHQIQNNTSQTSQKRPKTGTQSVLCF